jgi:RNA exonuclease 1
MKLVLEKIKYGIDKVFPGVQADVPETELVKLLVHNIPESMSNEELHKVVPGDFTIEVKQSKGDRYSALAIFKNSQEADLAFDNVTGKVEQDTTGRPQKLVELKPNEKEPAYLIYVRKMGHGIPPGEISTQKRTFEGREDSNEHKKLKTTHKDKDEIMADLNKQEQETNVSEQVLRECSQNSKLSDDNPMEIQNLMQELRDRDICLAEKDRTINDLRRRLDKVKNLLTLALE